MNVSVKKGAVSVQKADAFIVGIPKGTKSLRGELGAVNRASKGALKKVFDRGEFGGNAGEVSSVEWGGRNAKRLVLVGLGDPKSLSRKTLKEAAAAAADFCARAKLRTAAFELPARDGSAADVCEALAEGLILSTYDPGFYRTKERRKKTKPLTRVAIAVGDEDLDDTRGGAQRGAAMAAGTNFARDLVNQPSNCLKPKDMAQAAKDLAAEYDNIRCTVWGETKMQKEGMGGILGVGRGSEEESQFIQLEYQPKDKKRRKKVAIVGKGLTFDTGGISIKPAAGMELMKFDMGGAAAVLGCFKILGELQPDAHVLGYVASAENMPDGRAIKPGDLLEMMSGLTVEVNNTDAEGRLVLADALHFAKSQKPAFIVDAATLTGACMIALGDVACGLMSEDDDLVELIQSASNSCGERVWRLPLFEEHRKVMDGHVADLKNTGPREGGALSAAGFLSCFAKGARWAHLDIAGTVWTESAKPINPKGATGFGAALFYSIVEAANR